MKPLPTALVVILAMLVGAGITYWTIRKAPLPAPTPAAGTPPLSPPEGQTRVKNPNESKLTREKPALDEAALDAAIAEAKEARKRGQLKPLATTPEEFARALGSFNYRIVEFIRRYPERPAAGSPDEEAYDFTIRQLASHYANLVSDEELQARMSDETPEQLAHLQAYLAAGSLDLNADTTTKLEAILQRVYGKLFPLEESDPDAEAKVDAATEEIQKELAGLLTTEQLQRLELMGADQVLFGLPQTEE